LPLALTACSFFDKDNTPDPTPLQTFTPEANVNQLWSTSVGNGADGKAIKLGLAVNQSKFMQPAPKAMWLL